MDVKGVLRNIKNKGFAETYNIYIAKRRERERKNRLAQFENYTKKNGVEVGPKSTADYYFDELIKKKTVVMVGLGKSVRGNLQYILNELNENEDFSDYHIYVRTDKDTDPIVKEYIEKNQWERTSTILKNGDYNRLLETAQYLITEVMFPGNWVKKKGQVYINTWHGTPLKKLGLAKNSDNIHKDGNTQKNFIEADYVLYPNEYTKDNLLASYKVEDLMKGKIVDLGYPRTGGMLAAAQSDQSELRRQLAPNGEKLYAYMPTWKNYMSQKKVVAESKELLDYLDEYLEDDQILYVNLHHKVSASIDYSVYKHIRQFPPTVDNYELLALTEALITDYSSVFYDYLALRRQIILYCADYEIYKKERGVYMELNELPFDKAVTPQEVLCALNRGKTYDDTAAYERFCTYDSVNNAKKLCSLLKGDKSQVNLEPIPKSGKKQVLLYSHTCGKSVDTDRLRKLVELKKNYKLYISCEMNRVDKNKDSAYPMLHEVPVIGVEQNFYYTSLGRVAIQMYQDHKISFKTAYGVLQRDYEITAKRWYGSAEFDLVIIYDVAEPEVLLAFALMEAKRKIFCFSDEMYERLKSGDRFLRDVLPYVLPKMKKIYVDTNEKADCLKKIYKKRIIVQKDMNADYLNQQIQKYIR